MKRINNLKDGIDVVIIAIITRMLTKDPQVLFMVLCVAVAIKLILYIVIRHKGYSFICLRNTKPFVLWLTGCSEEVIQELGPKLADQYAGLGNKALLIDEELGRELTGLNKKTKLSLEELIPLVGKVAAALEKKGISSIVTIPSPYKKHRKKVRSLGSNYHEVYIEVTDSSEESAPKKGKKHVLEYPPGISFENSPDIDLSITVDEKTMDKVYQSLIAYLKLNKLL